MINEWVVQYSFVVQYTHTLSGGPTKFTILDLNVPVKKEFGVYPSRKNSLDRLSWHFARKRCFYNLVHSSHMDLQYFRFDVIAYSPTVSRWQPLEITFRFTSDSSERKQRRKNTMRLIFRKLSDCHVFGTFFGTVFFLGLSSWIFFVYQNLSSNPEPCRVHDTIKVPQDKTPLPMKRVSRCMKFKFTECV